jgi:hypothetical protein
VNVGVAYEKIGNLEDADRFYKLAGELGIVHQREQDLSGTRSRLYNKYQLNEQELYA